MSARNSIDKKYVKTAAIVGLVYTVVVVIVGALFGKEAAGIAGSALTALAIAQFSKIKSLSFTRETIGQKEIRINIKKSNFYNVLLVVFAYFGFLNILAIIYFYTLSFFPVKLDYESMLSFVSNYFVAFSLVGINMVSYLFTGFIYAKTSTVVDYRGATIAAIIITILSSLLSVLILLLNSFNLGDSKDAFKQMLPYFSVWLFYIGLMVLGAHLGFKKRTFVWDQQPTPISGQ